MHFTAETFVGAKRCVFKPNNSEFCKVFDKFGLNFLDLTSVQKRVLRRSRRELSHEYSLAKIGFDTAENKPSKVWPAEDTGILPEDTGTLNKQHWRPSSRPSSTPPSICSKPPHALEIPC